MSVKFEIYRATEAEMVVGIIKLDYLGILPGFPLRVIGTEYSIHLTPRIGGVHLLKIYP